MKELSFARFFRKWKSQPKNGIGIHKRQKRKGILVWDSVNKGPYIRSIAGELS